jgi:hypothetical protein
MGLGSDLRMLNHMALISFANDIVRYSCVDFGHDVQNLCSPNEDFGRSDNISECVFEALFNVV